MVDHEELLKLIEKQHTFPTHYTHKIIGKNTPAFLAAVSDLIKTTVRLSEKSKKESANAAHISVTLELHALSAHEVVFLMEKSQKLVDVIYVL